MPRTATAPPPTRRLPDSLNLPATKYAPQVVAYAFRDGAKYSAFVLSWSVTETAPLVLELRFGAPDALNCYVNPPLNGALPAMPSASAVLPAHLDLAFRTVRFHAGLGNGCFSGDGVNVGSRDGSVLATVLPP